MIDEESNELEVVTPATGTPDGEMLAQFRQFRETHDLGLRDKFVCEHLHLVYGVARRFSGLGESLDDLIQEGAIGLVNSVDLFDPERGVKFSTYATHLISGQIQHYLRDRGRLIRQPAWVQEMNTRAAHTAEELAQELGRTPQPAEIAARLNISEEALHNVMAAKELSHVQSLTVPSDEPGDTDPSLKEREATADEKLISHGLPVEDRLVIEEAIEGLKTLEQRVVRLYFYQDLSQTEIARSLQISVNYASYLLRRAIEKMRVAVMEQHAQDSIPPLAESVRLPADMPTFDPTTGVYTGAYLQVRVAEEIARSQRFPTNFALMVVEVRRVPGSPPELVAAGDGGPPAALLTAIGGLLRSSTRVVDLASYLGGARFGLLLPHTGREATVLADRICRRFELLEEKPEMEAGGFSLNVGFAVFPMDGVHPDMLFHRAEHALGEAIKLGPNRSAAVN